MNDFAMWSNSLDLRCYSALYRTITICTMTGYALEQTWMQKFCSCMQIETFNSLIEKQLQNQTSFMPGKVWIWTEILSVHEKTNIYAAVRWIFNRSIKIIFLQKITFFCQFSKYQKIPPQQQRYLSSYEWIRFSLRFDEI